MPYLQTNELRIFYQEQGQGEPLILLHEYFGTHQSWRKQIDVLSRNFRVIAIDLRAHGRTSYPGGRIRITNLATDTAGFIQCLECGPVHLVGSSLGALTGLLLARQWPKLVHSLTAIGPPQIMELGTLAYAERFINEIYPAEPQRWERGHDEYPKGHVRSVLLHNFALDREQPPEDMIAAVEQASEIACPTIVIGGDNDDVFPVHRAVSLAHRIPDAELCILPRGGHFPHRTMPEIFNPILLNFLQRYPMPR